MKGIGSLAVCLATAVCPFVMFGETLYRNGAALNVNFYYTGTKNGNPTASDSTVYGVVPFEGTLWRNVTGTASGPKTRIETTSKLQDSASHTITLKTSSRGFETQKSDASQILLRDTLIDDYNDYNDGKPESMLTFEGIPYENYDVYLYMPGTVNSKISPVRVTYSEGEAETAVTRYYYYNVEGVLVSVESLSEASSWGTAATWDRCTVGTNVMRIPNLTAANITFGAAQISDKTRANFAAVQIVERVETSAWEVALAADASLNASAVTVSLSGASETTKKLSELTIGDPLLMTLSGNTTIVGDVSVDTLVLSGSGELTFSDKVTIASTLSLSKSVAVNFSTFSMNGEMGSSDGTASERSNVTISGTVDNLGNLGSNVSVTLADGSTLGTVTNGTATYERAIAIGSGSTLTFSSSTPTVLKDAKVSGDGSLTIAGGAFTFGAGARGTYKGKTTVAKNATLVLANGDDTLSAETADDALVTIDGTLIGKKKSSGTTATTYYRKTAGTGTIQVPEGETFVIGQDYGNGVTGLTAFKGALELGGTFEARMWQSRTYTLSGLSVKFTSKSGELTGGSEGTAKLNLSSGTTLSGSGKVKIPVTFDGGVLDASAGGDALTLEEAVTCTGENKVKVKLADSQLSRVFLTTSDGVLNRSQLALVALDSESEALAGTVFVETVVGSTHSFSLMKKPTMEGMPEAVTENDEVMNKIYGVLSQVSGVEKLTGVELWNTAWTVSEKTNLADVLTLFDGVALGVKQDATDTKAGKVVAIYDFGVSDLTLKKVGGTLTVFVCAKVANSETAATNSAAYADGTTVALKLTKVVKGTDEAGNATSTTTTTSYTTPLTESELAAVGLTAVTGELWFAVPMTDLASGTNNFTVEASK